MGKTVCRLLKGVITWKHPHERGEDSVRIVARDKIVEPPHERGEDIRKIRHAKPVKEPPHERGEDLLQILTSNVI